MNRTPQRCRCVVGPIEDCMNNRHITRGHYLLLVNFILSWLVLPFLIDPFYFRSISDYVSNLGMSIGIQVAALVNWPLALVMSLIFGGAIRWVDLAWLLIYPALTFLLIRVAVLKSHSRFDTVLLHSLIALSFGKVWHSLIYGFDFMVG